MNAQGKRGSPMEFKVALFSCLAFALSPLTALSATDTDGNAVGVHVQHGVSIPNDTGQDANDLHIRARQKEDNITMNGASASSNDWGNVDVKMQPPHGMTADLDGGNIPKGGNTIVNFDFWISEKNQIWLDYQWTKDGEIIGGAGNGWKVKIPMGGGNGGLPGAQGGGGGAGNFIHDITIYNEKSVASQLLSFAAYASMTRLDTGWDVDWNSVPTMLSSPVTIAANDSMSFGFETTGSYAGGFIYLRYVLDDPMISVGVHPVPVPEPETYAMMLAGLGLLGAVARRRKLAAA